MTVNRICYILWVVFSLMFFIVQNNAGTMIILTVSVILPLMLGALAYFTAKKTEIKISANGKYSKKEKVKICLEIKNNSILPIQNVWGDIEVKNRLSKEKQQHSVSFGVKSKSSVHYDCEIMSYYAGEMDISFVGGAVRDVLGVFSFKVKNDIQGCNITVMPSDFDIELIISENPVSVVDSDIYSMEKSGNDASETFLIREYVSGDDIKNIHWKLSQKVDDIMVRELGLPIVSDVLVIFDNMCYKSLPSSKGIDAMADVLLSIMRELYKKETAFVLAFYDSLSEKLQTAFIKESDDIDKAVKSVMSSPFEINERSAVDTCAEYLSEDFERVIIITANETCDTSRINSGRINTLLYGSGGDYEDRGYVTVFSQENFRETLGVLEI